MLPFFDATVNTIPLVFWIPSTIITVIAVYIIHTKSPKSMKQYKTILIATTLIIFNGDITLTLAIGPKPLPGVIGTQNNGYIAMWNPSGGWWQLLYLMESLLVLLVSYVLCFSFREYTVIVNFEKFWNPYRFFKMLVYITAPILSIFGYSKAVASNEEARSFLKNLSVCQDCSVFVVIKTDSMNLIASIVGSTQLICIFFTVISIHRHLSAQRSLSPVTVKMQAMLLRALIWQTIIPLVMLASPLILMIFTFVVLPIFSDKFDPNSPKYSSLVREFGENVTVIAIIVPAFFSMSHIFCMFYFTTPYKSFLIGLFSRSSRVKQIAVKTPGNDSIS